MTETASPTRNLFGFLTVVKLPTVGHCGGLLVVSRIGRPIEFHCTAPVPENRAQEIMYGRTYPGFLCGEQIGMALVDKLKSQPTIFVTDNADVISISELIDQPLVFVEKPDENGCFDGRGLKHFNVNDQAIYCINTGSNEIEFLKQQVETFARTLPFEEPFERIYSAIEEANQVLRAG